MKIPKLWQRILWGGLGGALLISLIYWGGIPYTLALGLIATLGSLEYAELAKKQGLRPRATVILTLSLLMLAVVYAVQQSAANHGLEPGRAAVISQSWLGGLLLVGFIIFSASELWRVQIKQALENIATNLFGCFYIGWLLALTLLLRFLDDGQFLVLFTVLVTWANDTGAYFSGINLGRHKLSPKVSPHKTVEGAIGGIGASLLAALILAAFWQRPLLPLLLLGLIVAVAGQLGDLIESLFKRSAAIKDSGSFLPGHGGVLDRFDSLILAGPVVYFTVTHVWPWV